MSDALRIGVLACVAWAAIALAVQFGRARAYGRREWFAPPAAEARRGVAYAFGPGMSPTAKESVRENLPAYFAGVAYHLGIFAAAGLLALWIAGFPLAGSALASLSLAATRALTLLGALGGTALLARRALMLHLRALSCPDDFVANGLATLFVALAFARTLTPAVEAAFPAAAMLLLAYVPVGKIRHCVFFFSTRYHAGVFFGRRGVLPPAA